MWGSLRGLARLLAVLVTAAVAGLLALVGAATVTARPEWFLAAGLGVFLAAAAAGVALATRRLPGDRRRRARLTGFAAAALAGVAVFVVAVLLPVGDPRLAPAPVAGQRQWALPTGSRIAYVHRPGPPRPRGQGGVLLPGRPGPGPGRRQQRRRPPAPGHRPAAAPVRPAGPAADAAGLRPPPGQPAGRPPVGRPAPGPGPPGHPGPGRQGVLRLPAWSSGIAYRRALPGARLVYLRGAGHNAYQDQPAAFLAVVRAFLAGRPSPVPAWPGDGVPDDYEGPS